nr:DeoR/GlpR family DNA-binding transcription regulator [uncultured Amphritea sp.]
MVTNKKTKRQKRIIEELGFQPGLRITELAEKLGVSAETVRRDLDELTAQGMIDRTYGGAVIRKNMQEPVLNERQNLMVEERQKIARAAVPVLMGGKHFMIGSGATTVHLARRMAYEMNNITVFTHSFGVATVLSLNPTIKVLMAPGCYYAPEGALHGSQTIRYLQNFRADWAILGASGLDLEGGSDAVIEAGEVYGAMIARSTRTMIVADHSKFNLTFAANYCRWEEVDALVSDVHPTQALADVIEAAGTSVVTFDK